MPVRYYLECRDPEFKQKMAEVLCVYREVKLIKETAAAAKQEPSDAVAIVSYDEKPGVQAIAATVPDLPPAPGKHTSLARDHEYKRHGAVSLRPAHSRRHLYVTRYTEGFSHFVTSMTAPLERSPGGTCTHWKAPPFTAHARNSR